jgi:peptidyl-prolyl cis-trans isomerase C
VKNDLAISIFAVLAVALLCFGLANLFPATRPSVMGAAASTSRPGATALDDPARVVMRVDGQPITLGEFQAAFAALPEQLQQQWASEQGKRALAEQLIRIKLLERKAEELGVDKQPEVAGRIETMREQLLANAVLPKLVRQPSDAVLRTEYQKDLSKFRTVKLRHILISYEGGAVPPRSGRALPVAQAQARGAEIAARLRGGADFASLARQASDDQSSAQNGGELGLVGRGMLPAEIEPAVFNLQNGQISDPIRSRFGYHVFQVTSTAVQPFDQARPTLTQAAQRKQLTEVVEGLRTRAVVNFDPAFFPARPLPLPQKPVSRN